MIRKNLGKGKGQGYKNILNKDIYVHGLNAKGIKSKNVIILKIPKQYQDIPTKNFRLQYKEFEKKGLIKDIARQVSNGVKWAIEWEKEHLPQQEQWVKDEYNKAKESIKNGLDNVKHLSEQQKDVHDVRDELDHDDDGVPDIDIEDLEYTNEGIKQELSNIDLDDTGIPDAHEDGTFMIDDSEPFTQAKVNSNKEGVISKIKKGYEEYREKSIAETKRIKDMSDRELRELAIRDDSDESVLSIFSSSNKYEKELLRREQKRIEIAEKEKQAKIQAKENIKNKPESIFSI